jgi:integrase
VKSRRIRQAGEDFKFLCDEELGRLLAAIGDPDRAQGSEKLKRLRDLVIITMMALQALRTVELHRANVEDLADKGGNPALLVRGKTRDRLVYLRPDAAVRLEQYLALRGPIEPDETGTPLFTVMGNHGRGLRLAAAIFAGGRTCVCMRRT